MKKRSSFHMGGEFNGYGEVRYLKGTRPKVRTPISQENVRLSPDFGYCLLKMLGSIPVVIFSSNMNPVVRAAIGSQAVVNQVIIRKNEKTGGCLFHLKTRNIRELTNGSYPYTFKDTDREEPIVIFLEDQWVKAGESEDEKWKYYANGRFIKGDWVKSKGRWYCIGVDGYMVRSQIREWEGKFYYLKEDGAMAANEKIKDHESGRMYEADSQGVLSEVDWTV